MKSYTAIYVAILVVAAAIAWEAWGPMAGLATAGLVLTNSALATLISRRTRSERQS